MNKTQKLFEKYATEGEHMDALEALKLLTKAYMKECGFSIGMRTMFHHAGEIWLIERLPKQENNPFSEEQLKQSYASLMPLICNEFDPDYHGTYDTWYFDHDTLKNLCLETIEGKWYDEPTLKALCWSIKVMPELHEKWCEEELRRTGVISSQQTS